MASKEGKKKEREGAYCSIEGEMSEEKEKKGKPPRVPEKKKKKKRGDPTSLQTPTRGGGKGSKTARARKRNPVGHDDARPTEEKKKDRDGAFRSPWRKEMARSRA